MKRDCIDCEQVSCSKGTYNMIKTEIQRRGFSETKFYLAFDFCLELLS